MGDNGEGRPLAEAARDRRSDEQPQRSRAERFADFIVYPYVHGYWSGDVIVATCGVCGMTDCARPDLHVCPPHRVGMGRFYRPAPPPPTDYPCDACGGRHPLPKDGKPPMFVLVCWAKDYCPVPRRPAPTSGTGKPDRRLAGLLRHLNGTVEGERNATLFWVSCRVGEMIATGELSDVAATVDVLTDVALGTGLTPGEVAGTIRSGLRSSGATT